MQKASSTTPLPLPMQRRRQELSQLAESLRHLAPRRVVVAGGPRSGKTTFSGVLSNAYRVPVRGTDDLKGLGWSESSMVASSWLDMVGPWICEGVVMPRAMRKWLARNPDGKPGDLVVWMNEPVSHRVDGQTAMALGCNTVFEEILPALAERGVQVLRT